MRTRILSILICMAYSQLYGQLDNTVFENRTQVAAQDSNRLYLGLNVLGFGKNNEYSETTIDGYTLFGYQVNPFLSYQLGPKLRLDAGVYAQKDFGNNDYTDVLPTFSLKYQAGNFALIFGTLEGSLNHRLIEPLYNFEFVLNRRIENGVQTLWMKDDVFLDVWVDWQKMIYQEDPNQEEFVGGLSFSKRVEFGGLDLSFPVQATVYHRGGQIDVNPDPVLTLLNGAIGVDLESGSGFVWGIKSYYVFHSTSSNELPFNSGNGIFLNPYFKTRFGLTLMGSWWTSHQYLTYLGDARYPSISPIAPVEFDEDRSWIMVRALYDIRLTDGVTLTLRAQPFFDTFSDKLQYSYGFYINLNKRFFLLHANR